MVFLVHLFSILINYFEEMKNLMSFLTLDHVNVTHQNVLLRLDLNLPISQGSVSDSTRITRSLPTINELIAAKAKVIILSHYGRPQGKRELKYSLEPIADHLKQFVGCPVAFAKDCLGNEAEKTIAAAPFGSIVILENVRFYPQEEQNDALFAEKLAALGHLYVNDAFSCSHRAHASIEAICHYLPSYAGRALQQELQTLQAVLESPKKPVMAIVGGSKVSSKIKLLQNLVQRVDYLVIGGGMANTFLAAQAIEIGTSLYEEDYIPTAQEILIEAETKGCEIILPIDVAVTGAIVPHCQTTTVSVDKIGALQKVADIGPKSVSRICYFMDQCQTLVWNGPVGVFEITPFDQGSVALAKHISTLTNSNKLISVAGGGDTLAALNKAGVAEDFTYTSTAGGAFLEWLEGTPLPGILALQKNF